LEVYVMTADGSGQTNLTNNAAFDGTNTWSPDGTKIAFVSDRDGNSEIYVMNADGSGQTRLTNNAAIESFPDWSPDGTKMAFETDRDANFEIYMMNVNGSGQINLTNNASDEHNPSWGPIVLTSKAQCLKGGWAAFGFKNQGQCISQSVRGTREGSGRPSDRVRSGLG
jgi:Tol biopolymer transport system component